jgi:hypothetical protein
MGADISVNRKALRDYHILERLEAGLELKGTEVKAIRSGLANVSNAFARIEKGQAFVYDLDIQPYVRAQSRAARSETRQAVIAASEGNRPALRADANPGSHAGRVADVLEGRAGEAGTRNRQRQGRRTTSGRISKRKRQSAKSSARSPASTSGTVECGSVRICCLTSTPHNGRGQRLRTSREWRWRNPAL